ncbi:hypothetical protein [Polyangium aurulentum]|uniref:hypothetical protein n=1 Tax=Polyangium aurulentum TaxID=2567896 RepID=UPI0010ADBFE4|nr:hypothetical protein [Polyangium aurulentum]UQA59657.1 hypothetical protein E8A73_003890 [Polyangium aurulentum]
MGASKPRRTRRGRTRTILLPTALLALLGAPAQARAQGPAPYMAPPPGYPSGYYHSPIPPGYQRITTVNTPLVIAGAVTFGLSHGAAVALGAAVSVGNEDGFVGAPLFLPIVGPPLALQAYGDGGALGPLFIGNAVLQGVGFGLLVAGLSLRTESVVPYDQASARPAPELLVGPGSLGMRLRF